MPVASIFKSAMRWAFWPIVVVGGLNIEKRAEGSGYDKIDLSQIARSISMTEVYQDLTSDTALYILIFIAGGSVFSWLGYLIERLEKSEKWAIHNLSLECNTYADLLGGKTTTLPFISYEGALRRLNARLERFGFEPIPPLFDRTDKERNKRTSRYLRAIAPLMSKDLDYARRLGQAAISLNQAEAVSRQSHVNIGRKTQP